MLGGRFLGKITTGAALTAQRARKMAATFFFLRTFPVHVFR
jgi:hypothetical protein